MIQAESQLEYAPAPTWTRKRLFRRVVLPVLTLLVAALAWHYSRPVVDHLQMLQVQRRTFAYAPVQGRVIYDDDPQRVSTLLRDPTYASSHPAMPNGTFALYDNPAFQAYHRRVQRSARPAPPAALIGRLTSPSGNTRFVIVQWTQVPPGNAPIRQFVLRPSVEIPATLLTATRSVPAGPPTGLEMFVAPGDRTRLLEGQIDPTDPSHFTMDYVHNDVAGTIDGWLNDDDTVTLGPRTGDVLEHNPTYRWWSPVAGGFPPHIYQGTLATRLDPTTRPVVPKRDDPRFK